MIYRVFVSSTCHDLIDARADLEAEIRSLGLHPVMSDRPTSEFEVGPEVDSIKSCLANVDSADVVLVLFNQRYGPSLADGPYPGLSATHAEVKRALEAKKPIFFFARDRFLSDMELCKAGGLKRCKWLQEKDGDRLVAFFDEVSKLRQGGQNNWYDTFTNSVDLKALVRTRLGRVSRRGQVMELINSNNLPTLLCWLDHVPAFLNEVVKEMPILIKSVRGDLYDLEILYEQMQKVKLGFLAEHHQQSFKITGHYNTETPLKAKYYTVEGHKIEEEWYVVLRSYSMVVSLVKRTVTPGSVGRIQVLDES